MKKIISAFDVETAAREDASRAFLLANALKPHGSESLEELWARAHDLGPTYESLPSPLATLTRQDPPRGLRYESEILHFASQVQHQQCVAIQRAVIARYSYRGLRGYTTDIDRPYEQFRRIMRGDAVMQLRDLAEAKLHFGNALNLNVLLLVTGVTTLQ